jgi:hypothetical protein
MSNETTPFGLESSTNQFWNLTVNNANGNLEFNANRNDSGGGDLRLVINDDNGNVGIGTADPNHKLHVEGGSTKISGSAYIGLPGSTPYANINYCGYAIYSYSDDTALYGRSGNAFGPALAVWNVGGGYDIGSYGGKNFFDGKVGIGTRNTGNDMLDVRGRCYSSGGWHTTNQDYAEYFESENGSVILAGTTVTLTNGKVRPTKKDEIPIGIITTNSAIVGNSYKEWPKKYLRDDFGNLIMEKYNEEVMVPKKEKVKKERQKVQKKIVEEEITRTEVVYKNGKYRQVESKEKVSREIEESVFKEVDLYNEKGEQIIGKYKVPLMETYEEEIEVLDEKGEPVMVGSGQFEKKERPKINPSYDEKKKYIPREDRPEWNCVGLLGQLPLLKGQPVAKSWVKIKDLSDDLELWLVK